MKKLKKQEEFSKMLDLGKEDIANLSLEAMLNIQGGYTVPLPTNDGAHTCEGNCTGETVCIQPTYDCTAYHCNPGHSMGTACYCNTIAGYC